MIDDPSIWRLIRKTEVISNPSFEHRRKSRAALVYKAILKRKRKMEKEKEEVKKQIKRKYFFFFSLKKTPPDTDKGPSDSNFLNNLIFHLAQGLVLRIFQYYKLM